MRAYLDDYASARARAKSDCRRGDSEECWYVRIADILVPFGKEEPSSLVVTECLAVKVGDIVPLGQEV